MSYKENAAQANPVNGENTRTPHASNWNREPDERKFLKCFFDGASYTIVCRI